MNGQPPASGPNSSSPQVRQRQGYDPALAQHKQWQTVHLFQVDVKDNPFHPLDITNGLWKQGLGKVGGVLGTAIAAWAVSKTQKPGSSDTLKSLLLKSAATTTAAQVGSSAFAKIGFLIDNAHTIGQNIDTAFSTPPQSLDDLDDFMSDVLP